MTPPVLQSMISWETAYTQRHFAHHTPRRLPKLLLLCMLSSEGLDSTKVTASTRHSILNLVVLNRESEGVRCDELVVLSNDNVVANRGLYSVLEQVFDNGLSKYPLRTLVLVFTAYNHLLSFSSP